MEMKKTEQFAAFDEAMVKILSVSHDQLKATLNAEKQEKAAKKRKAKPSASRESFDREGT